MQLTLTQRQTAAIENAVKSLETDIRRLEQQLRSDVSNEGRVSMNGRGFANRDRRERMVKMRNVLAPYYCHREELYNMLQKPTLDVSIHKSLLDGEDLLPLWLELQYQRDNNPDNPDAGRIV